MFTSPLSKDEVISLSTFSEQPYFQQNFHTELFQKRLTANNIFPHSFNISKSIFHSCPQSMNALISPHLLLGEFFYIFSSCISFGSYFVFGTKKYIWKLLFFFSKVRICNNLCIFEIYT